MKRQTVRRAIGITVTLSGAAALVYSVMPDSWRGLGIHSTKRALPIVVFESVNWQSGIALSVATRAGLEEFFVNNEAADAWAMNHPNAISDGHLEWHWANPGDPTPWRSADAVLHRAQLGSVKVEWQLSRVPADFVGPHFVLALPWSVARSVAAALMLLPTIVALQTHRRGGPGFDVAPRPPSPDAPPSHA